VLEICLVDSLEGVFLASIKSSGELDSGVRARAEIESSALDLCGCCSVASGLLGVAISDIGTGKSSGVGCVRAGGVLNGA